MAFLKPNLLVFIQNNGKPITAIVQKVAFRKYWGKGKNDDGKKVRKRKSMPYAICSVIMSQDDKVNMGAQFTIAGYMLQNVEVKGKTSLAFRSKYVAEFADQMGNEWVQQMINQEFKHETQ